MHMIVKRILKNIFEKFIYIKNIKLSYKNKLNNDSKKYINRKIHNYKKKL